jgi:hypothetical protein
MGFVHLAALCAILAGVPVPAAHQASFASIEANYEILSEAVSMADTTTMLALRDPALTVRLPNNRVVGYDAMAADMRSFFSQSLPPIKAKYTIQKALFLAPDSAFIVSSSKLTRYAELAGKKRKVENEMTQNDTWVLRPGGWKLRSIDFIRNQRRWVDGKEVDPTKAYDPKAPAYKPPRPAFEE